MCVVCVLCVCCVLCVVCCVLCVVCCVLCVLCCVVCAVRCALCVVRISGLPVDSFEVQKRWWQHGYEPREDDLELEKYQPEGLRFVLEVLRLPPPW